MFPGKLTIDQLKEYRTLTNRISAYGAHCEDVRTFNKKAKPQDRRQIDEALDLSNEEYFRWNELRGIGWS